MPIYLLGFMGATRRMEQFDPALQYQGLFIISGIGTAIIGLGVLLKWCS